MAGGRPTEWTVEKIEAEADYLVEWAEKPDSIVLGTCYGSRGYSYVDANEWAKENKKFGKAKAHAKTLVGARREIGGLINKLNPGIVSRTMPMYDPEYNEHVMALKKNQSESECIDISDLKTAFDTLTKNQSIVSDVDQTTS
jgi:hypothetical protein